MTKYVRLGIAMTRQYARFSLSMFLMSVANFFSLGLSLAIWAAVSTQYSIPGYTLSKLMLYMIVARIVRAGVGNRVDRDLANLIYRGNLAQELRLPVNHQVYTTIKVISRNVWTFLYETTVTCVLSGFLLPYLVPTDSGSAYPSLTPAVFVAVPSIVAALVLSVSLNYTVGIAAMWTKTQKGIAHLKDLLFAIMSGALIPLDLFPGWLRHIGDALPFRWVVYAPTRILIGSATTKEAVSYLVVQGVWILALVAANSLLWSRAVRRLEVYGG